MHVFCCCCSDKKEYYINSDLELALGISASMTTVNRVNMIHSEEGPVKQLLCSC